MSAQNPPESESSLTRMANTEIIRYSSEQSPVLSEIINRSLGHIQTSKILGKPHRIGEHELKWPDYQFVCLLAEQLKIQPENVMLMLLEQIQVGRGNIQTTLIEGRFFAITLGPRFKGIRGFPSIEGLQIKLLLVKGLGLCDLDLHAVPQLTGLACTNNKLYNLDLSPVPNLTKLWCHFNILAELDLSPVPNLTVLHCYENRLIMLNLCPVPNLTVLLCNNNLLSDLDLSPVANLTELDCARNQLTAIDLSQVPNLTRLECDGNHMTELDIRPLQHLKTLKCDPIRLIQRPDQNF